MTEPTLPATMADTVTGKEMCEAIHNHWSTHHPDMYARFPSPRSIWDYSPSGELTQVFVWYEEAVQHERLLHES